MNAFAIAPTPQLHFGPGSISVLPSTIKSFGSRPLLITGARSFLSSTDNLTVMEELKVKGFAFEHASINHEPTPAMIDAIVNRYSPNAPDVVVAIGGGSVLDAGKAISAMLPINEPVKEYLEGVGKKLPHPGIKVPFIAVPTTSGTGSEATKNAVLSETGPGGYKKSLRHNNFVPDVAIVDSLLSVSCPPAITASSGMDAFTQLLESYVSTAANPITDALAYKGLRLISDSLLAAYHDGTDIEARSNMALAAYLSGITLANAGLGLVHGFASSIGGYFDIPHGTICSSLMAAANTATIRRLRSDKNNTEATLKKFAAVGRLFSETRDMPDDYYVDALLALLENWTIQLKIPPLMQYGILPADYVRIVDITDNKNNPVPLSRDEMTEVLDISCNRRPEIRNR